MLFSRSLRWVTVSLALALPQSLPADESPILEKTPAQLFEELDKNKDGTVTAEEAGADGKAGFDRLVRVADKDGNGELSRDEFLAGAKPAEREPAARQPAETQNRGDFFRRFDANGDGMIALDEVPEAMKERLQRIFERTGKTELPIAELQGLFARLMGAGAPGGADPAGPGQRFTPAFFRKLDADGDGKLSKDEWQKAVDAFSQLDANGDGYLELPELMGRPGGRSMIGRRPEGDENRPRRPDGAGAEPPTGPQTLPPAAARPNAAGAKPKGNANRLRKLDSNGDGKISRDEAKGRLRENFDRIDSNSNGYLEPAEMRKALDQLGEGRKAGTTKKRPKLAHAGATSTDRSIARR